MNSGERRQLPVVGVGASAGGIEAFRGFFENLPDDSGLAFVVVLHLPADRKSLLAEIIGRWTAMPVVDAEQGTLVRPNTVYVPPPGVALTFSHGGLRLHPAGPEAPREPTPIDVFFNSLAVALGEDAIGVVLSGTGSDGALGLKAIKERGGLTLAQGTDGTAPLHAGMPSSAIATGAVDIVASVQDMPGHILDAYRRNFPAPETDRLPEDEDDGARIAICNILHRHTGHDFSGYKERTFMRRVNRRMNVLNLTSLSHYVARLEADRDEAILLFRDLLIGVTSFFRDADTFDALKRTVIPRLFAGKTADSSVRVWVAGCATGEEAYSLAILLCEHADGLLGSAPHIQVFGTDIDEAAITTSRAGRYPSSLLDAMSRERLERFFVEGSNGSYTVGRDVRAVCTFSVHSLIRDPPFSRMDLISCRNLLIYLDADLQSFVVPSFHYALAPDGILLLGSSESVSRHERLFTPLDRAHRIFQRRSVPSPAVRLRGHSPRRYQASQPAPTNPPEYGRKQISKTANRAGGRVLERYAPPYVVVTADGTIVQYSSRTGRFLEPVAGHPNQSVFAMARRGLRVHLQTALKQAVESGRPIETPRMLATLAPDEARWVSLAIDPMPEQGGQPTYLVVFLEAPASDEPAERAADISYGHQDASSQDRQIETELSEALEQLQSITEEHETALEELRSSNEELHSVNEELQSTNEELETSKEEIQSINEELHAANTQLSGNVEELDRRNTDLLNLFESTQVATIFLDPYMIIRGFTPAVADIYNLIPSDQGRPLTDIVSRLRYAELREDNQRVLSTLAPIERRVVRSDGTAHYIMRILPYRTPDSAVDGTLVTFVDVTTIVEAEQHQRLLVDELNHRVKNMLTVVISMATQTMRRARTMEDFSTDFLGRVHALTAAYSLLSNESWQTVSLQDLLMEELRPFVDRANLAVHGPRVMLQPRAALALGMAIHELTTNAVKYGALSVAEGEVNVSWDVLQEAGGERLAMRWVERGGPRVQPPARQGFGMVLIERGLRQDMSAQVEVDFQPEGVIATLRAPLGHSGDTAEAGAGP